jgi:hypothetical protein
LLVFFNQSLTFGSTRYPMPGLCPYCLNPGQVPIGMTDLAIQVTARGPVTG